MSAAQAKQKSGRWMPAFGLIEGGQLDGHRYLFHGFVVKGETLLVDATVSRPHWPFPKRQLLWPGDYETLHAVPGERAKRIATESLITSAWACAQPA